MLDHAGNSDTYSIRFDLLLQRKHRILTATLRHVFFLSNKQPSMESLHLFTLLLEHIITHQPTHQFHPPKHHVATDIAPEVLLLCMLPKLTLM
jgi:hypothetical protein